MYVLCIVAMYSDIVFWNKSNKAHQFELNEKSQSIALKINKDAFVDSRERFQQVYRSAEASEVESEHSCGQSIMVLAGYCTK